MVVLGTVPPAAAQSEALVVRDAWVREAAAGDSTAAYLTIENSTDVPAALVTIETGAAEIVELHQMTMAADERMSMALVSSVPVPPGGHTELRPGGYHAMLFQLPDALEIGETVELVMHFRDGTTVAATARVLPRAAIGP